MALLPEKVGRACGINNTVGCWSPLASTVELVGHQAPSSEKVKKIFEATAGKVEKAARAIAVSERKPVKH